MRTWLLGLVTTFFLVSCKTYEEYGGVRWDNSFQSFNGKYPIDVFAARTSNDSAVLVIKLLGSERDRGALWNDSLTFLFKVFADTTGGDKFNFYDSTSIVIPAKTVATNSDAVVTKAFSLNNKIRWLWINVESTGIKQRRMIDLPLQNALAPLTLDSANIVVNPNSLQTQATYRFTTIANANLKVSHFPFPIYPASPSYRHNDLASTNLLADTTFITDVSEGFRFDDPGVYRFNDSVAKQTFVVTLHNDNFPDLRRPKDLIRPLRYITKNEEYNNLINAANPKQAIDSFWLSKSRAEVVAKKSIRVFYNRVEEANRLFTAYLPGWMTDRGMILIMYGEPDRSYKFKEGEIWTYTRNFPRTLEFVFVRSESFLGTEYNLRRDPEYKTSWDQQSFKWRTGGILNDVQDIY